MIKGLVLRTSVERGAATLLLQAKLFGAHQLQQFGVYDELVPDYQLWARGRGACRAVGAGSPRSSLVDIVIDVFLDESVVDHPLADVLQIQRAKIDHPGVVVQLL